MAFIVFEGLDGAGKSTLIKALVEELSRRKIPLTQTREPGGTPLAEEIRHLLIRPDDEVPCPETELLLYQAARAQHVSQVIRPSLKAGKWVISDRFTPATYAFQVGGRGLKSEDVDWLSHYATGGIKPDLVVLLDLPVQESKARMEKRFSEKDEKADRFEKEKQDFHERVRKGYLEMAKRDPKRWLVLDATLNPKELTEKLFADLKAHQWLD